MDLWARAEARGVPPAVAVAAQRFLAGGGTEVAARSRGGCAEVERGPGGEWRLSCLNGGLPVHT